MAPARGGRGRGARQDRSGDAFAAALRSVLADVLDVAADRLEVSVRLDGAAVAADRVVGSIGLVDGPGDASDASGPAGPSDDDASEADAVAASPVAASSAGRSDRGPAAARAGARRDEEDEGGSERGMERGAERESSPVTQEELDEEAEAAADLLEGLLDAMKVDGDLRINVLDTHAEVEIVGADEGVLIGRRGQTLEAIQDLVRTAMQRRFERRSRVLVDVDGYRARRIERLLERADEAVQEVIATGEPQRLEPMDTIERRLVHQRVASHEGVISTSHGREPARRIVIELAQDE